MQAPKIVVLLGAFLLVLGFNTIDAMMWEFYYHPWLLWFPNQWGLTPTFFIDVWIAYLFLGILPLVVGSLILGFVLGNKQ